MKAKIIKILYFIYLTEFFPIGATHLDFDLSAKLVVREAMSSPVIGVNKGYSVVDARAKRVRGSQVFIPLRDSML